MTLKELLQVAGTLILIVFALKSVYTLGQISVLKQYAEALNAELTDELNKMKR